MTKEPTPSQTSQPFLTHAPKAPPKKDQTPTTQEFFVASNQQRCKLQTTKFCNQRYFHPVIFPSTRPDYQIASHRGGPQPHTKETSRLDHQLSLETKATRVLAKHRMDQCALNLIMRNQLHKCDDYCITTRTSMRRLAGAAALSSSETSISGSSSSIRPW